MEIVLVDGLNVVRFKRNKEEFKTTKELMRSNLLLNRINEFNKNLRAKIEIIFDGYHRKLINKGYYTDIFFAKDKKADDAIVDALYSYREMQNSNNIFVVTSDIKLGQRCSQYGAEIINSETFLKQWLDFYQFATMA